MANMNIPVSILGCGIVVLPVKEYEATKQSLAYAFEQLREKEQQLNRMRGEVEGLKQDKDAIDSHLVACFQAFRRIQDCAGEIVAGASHAYMNSKASEIEKLCQAALENRLESKEGEEG